MQAEPASTARIIARIESGFVGSTGSALTNARNGFAHHCFAISVSTAKIGSPGRNAPKQQSVEKRRVVGGDHRVRQRRARVLEPLDLHAVEHSEDQAQRGSSPSSAAGSTPPRARPGSSAVPHSPNSSPIVKPRAEERSGPDRGDRHRERVDDVVGRDHARAMRRLAFVLQDRVERHGEETARHRDADEIRENAPASRASAGRPIRSQVRRPTGGQRWPRCRSSAKNAIAGAGDRHVARAHLAVQQPLG